MKHLLGAILLIGVLCVLAGCGGGSSSGSITPPTLTRTSLTNESEVTARSIRQVAPLATSFSGGSIDDSKSVLKSGASLAQRVIARSAATTRDSGSGYLNGLNLYYTYTINAAGTSATFLLYSDSGMTNQVGTITINATGTPGSYPVKANVSLNITVGADTVSGTMSITVTSATSGTVAGKLNANGATYSFNLSITSSGINGPLTLNAGDGSSVTVTLQPPDSNGDVDATFTSTFKLKGSAVLHPDGSGSLTITDANGNPELTMVWDSSGNATITYADGSTTSVTL